MPRVLLIGQAPGLSGSTTDRPFAGPSGDPASASGSRPAASPATTSGGRSTSPPSPAATPAACPAPGATGSPEPAERALCRPWLEEVVAVVAPEVVLLLGLLAIRTALGPVPSLSAVVGTTRTIEGVRYLPLPHPSGVSRWLNDPPNREAVARAMAHLRGWVEELGI